MFVATTRRTVAAMAAALAASIPLAAINGTKAHAMPQSLYVVAVGDSYASGQGAKGSGWTDAACERSALAAPQQAAAQLSAVQPTAFASQACSGSIIEDPSGQTNAAHRLLGPSGQLSQVGVPGQRVDGLTISIGGNDIGFASIVQGCAIPVYECENDPGVTGPLAANLGALPGKLADLVNAVQGGGRVVPADVRNVFVTEYPDPTTGPGGFRCGSVFAPAFEGFDGLSESEAQWASQQVVAPLNADLQMAVNAANSAPGTHPAWHFVTGISRAFATHGYCTGIPSPTLGAWGNPRYINTPIDSLNEQGDIYGSMHPNAQGQGVVAGIMAQNMSFLATPPASGVVPNVIGRTPQSAAGVVSSAGFAVAITSVVDPTCNNIGIVLTQSPGGGRTAALGSTVTLRVGVRPRTPCP